jgi:transcriptional regulator with XRE-family HTH domain
MILRTTDGPVVRTQRGCGYRCGQNDSRAMEPAGIREWRRGGAVALLRRVIGDALRARRQGQHRTLREVSTAANVSLGYLSEIERGQKEASSELLAAICDALGSQLSDVLRDASDSLARAESELVPVPRTALAEAGLPELELPQPELAPAELVPADRHGAEVPAAEVAVPAEAAVSAERLPKALAPRYRGGEVSVSVRRNGPLRTTLHAVRNRRPARTS